MVEHVEADEEAHAQERHPADLAHRVALVLAVQPHRAADRPPGGREQGSGEAVKEGDEAADDILEQSQEI